MVYIFFILFSVCVSEGRIIILVIFVKEFRKIFGELCGK